jgi:hypothetical protein
VQQELNEVASAADIRPTANGRRAGGGASATAPVPRGYDDAT